MMKKPSKYLQERRKFRNRPRKILNLEERVQAIQLYDRNPVYQRIACTFKCSWEQIKNVVLNREAILQYYALCQTVSTDDNPRTVRQKKVNFLGKVMYEFIKRAFYHMSCILNDEVIRDQALAFREILKIESFYPNKAWITDFKHAYHLNLAQLDNIVITEEPQKSLDPNDIIDYCNKELQQANQIPKKSSSKNSNKKKLLSGEMFRLAKETDDNDIDVRSEISDKDNEAGEIMDFGAVSDEEFANDDDDDDDDDDGTYDDINDNEEGPTINYGDYECDDDNSNNSRKETVTATKDTDEKSYRNSEEDDQKDNLILEDDKNSKDSQNDNKSRKRASTTTYAHFFTEDSSDNEKLRRSAKTRVGSEKIQSNRKHQNINIEDYTAALDLLRPLEEFAISEEDFGAINLLSQLNAVYQRAVKRKNLAQN